MQRYRYNLRLKKFLSCRLPELEDSIKEEILPRMWPFLIQSLEAFVTCHCQRWDAAKMALCSNSVPLFLRSFVKPVGSLSADFSGFGSDQQKLMILSVNEGSPIVDDLCSQSSLQMFGPYSKFCFVLLLIT